VNILYAVCAWGLGHATRSLPILRRLAREHRVIVYSDGPALALVRSELPDLAFVEAPAYPNIFGGRLLALDFFLGLPRLVRAMRAEYRETQTLVAMHGIDRVVSDSRWGVSSRRVPSIFISHHLRQVAPRGFRAAERLTEAVTWRSIHGRYRRILVPDVASGGGLSGRLAHELSRYDPAQLRYIGPISDVTRQAVTRDLDTLVVLGGPEPSRSRLEEHLLPGLAALPGRTVVLRGVPDARAPRWPLATVAAFPHAPKAERDTLFSAARVIVGRSGYTTLMDAASVGARALFIPLPGQTEQEYLAARLAQRGLTHHVRERDVDLPRDVRIAASRPGLDGLVPRGADPAAVAIEEIVA